MSERTEYAAGTPSWVDQASPDPGASAGFYSDLFGWETEDVMPEGSDGEYHMATLRGKRVAALGSNPMAGAPAGWNTYFTVDDADAAAAAAANAGGKVLMDSFDVMDAGRMAVLADPAGAVFMLWQPKETIGAEVVNEDGAWSWSELVTDDVEGSKRFYGELLGWQTTTMEFAGGEYTIWHRPGAEPKQAPPDQGGTSFGGMLPSSNWPDATPNFWLAYFAVADVDATAARAGELGGSVVAPAFDAPGVGRIAVLGDPQGAAFAIWTGHYDD